MTSELKASEDRRKNPGMLKHWREVKAQHPQTILFYRVGDFYEMFYEDAQLAARVLDITLTSRGDGVPLAGVPVKAAADYLRQLVARGAPGGHLRAGRRPQARQGPRPPRSRRDAHARRPPPGGLAGRRAEQLDRRGEPGGRADGAGSLGWPPSISAPANSCSRPSTARGSTRPSARLTPRRAGGARPARLSAPPSHASVLALTRARRVGVRSRRSPARSSPVASASPRSTDSASGRAMHAALGAAGALLRYLAELQPAGLAASGPAGRAPQPTRSSGSTR